MTRQRSSEGTHAANDIRNMNSGKSDLLRHWVGFSKDSVERVKRGQSIIDVETIKHPAAKKDNRPSLWGLNVTTEAQKNYKDSTINKALLRRKLDQFYKETVDESIRI